MDIKVVVMRMAYVEMSYLLYEAIICALVREDTVVVIDCN